MLKPIVLDSHEAVSQYASDLMVAQVRTKPNSLFCLASGGTPTRTYELFVEKALALKSVVGQLRTIKLDEWGGLAMDDPASCEHHLRRTIIEPLGLADRYMSFRSDTQDHVAECQRMASCLSENGPIDLCILGLGTNGHVGFNEPADFLQPHAHVAHLSAASLNHGMLNVSRSRPTCGITLGMADLLQSREIILLVTGPSKREALQRLLSNTIDTHFPASLLTIHCHVTLLCDRDAV